MLIQNLDKDVPIVLTIDIWLGDTKEKIQINTKSTNFSETENKILSQILKTENYKGVDLKTIKNLFIDFESEKIKYSLIAVVNGEAYIYNNCKLRSVELNSVKEYVILTDGEGKQLLRRTNHRMILGKNGVVDKVDKKKNLDVKIRDIGGIGIVSDTSNNFEIGDVFTINFKDDEETNFTLQVQIVRIEEQLEDVLLGCVILEGRENIKNYISKRQVERLNNGGKVVL